MMMCVFHHGWFPCMEGWGNGHLQTTNTLPNVSFLISSGASIHYSIIPKATVTDSVDFWGFLTPPIMSNQFLILLGRLFILKGSLRSSVQLLAQTLGETVQFPVLSSEKPVKQALLSYSLLILAFFTLIFQVRLSFIAIAKGKFWSSLEEPAKRDGFLAVHRFTVVGYLAKAQSLFLHVISLLTEG